MATLYILVESSPVHDEDIYLFFFFINMDKLIDQFNYYYSFNKKKKTDYYSAPMKSINKSNSIQIYTRVHG